MRAAPASMTCSKLSRTSSIRRSFSAVMTLSRIGPSPVSRTPSAWAMAGGTSAASWRRREVDEGRPCGELVLRSSGGRDREAALADAARSGEGDETQASGRVSIPATAVDLVLSPDELVSGAGKVRAASGSVAARSRDAAPSATMSGATGRSKRSASSVARSASMSSPRSSAVSKVLKEARRRRCESGRAARPVAARGSTDP